MVVFYLTHIFEVSRIEVLISRFFWACFSKPPDLHVVGVGSSDHLSGTCNTCRHVMASSLDSEPSGPDSISEHVPDLFALFKPCTMYSHSKMPTVSLHSSVLYIYLRVVHGECIAT